MKKVVSALAAVMVMVLAFTSCSAPLSSEFNEQEVVSQATEVVELLSEKKYDEVCSRFDPVMKQSIADGKALEKALGEILDSLGDFKSVEKAQTAGSKDSAGNPIAVAVLVCDFTNKKAVFTISIDKNDKICGLYVK